jgi:hypothetical protein
LQWQISKYANSNGVSPTLENSNGLKLNNPISYIFHIKLFYCIATFATKLTSDSIFSFTPLDCVLDLGNLRLDVANDLEEM